MNQMSTVSDAILTTVTPAGECASPEAESFYAESLRLMKETGFPFLVAGTYAVSAYTGITRPTKDVDMFCKPGDYPKILGHFQRLGFRTEVPDERWLAKVHKEDLFFDVIFASSSGMVPITDRWFEEAPNAVVCGIDVQIVPPTELIWSKAFIQYRERYDGADVAHLILKLHDRIDWKRLLSYMDQYWEVLLMHLLNFRFIYPSERELVPRWLIDELLERLKNQMELPTSQIKICRGRLFSPTDYLIDIKEWGFADMLGKGAQENVGR